MRNKILATLIVLGIVAFWVCFAYLCFKSREFVNVMVYITLGTMGLCFIGWLLYSMWSAIYDSLRD